MGLRQPGFSRVGMRRVASASSSSSGLTAQQVASQGAVTIRTATIDFTVGPNQVNFILPTGVTGRLLPNTAWIVVETFDDSPIDATTPVVYHAGDGSTAESQQSLLQAQVWSLVEINAVIDNGETSVIGSKPSVPNFPRSTCNLALTPRVFITQAAAGPAGFILTGHFVMLCALL